MKHSVVVFGEEIAQLIAVLCKSQNIEARHYNPTTGDELLALLEECSDCERIIITNNTLSHSDALAIAEVISNRASAARVILGSGNLTQTRFDTPFVELSFPLQREELFEALAM